MLWSVLVPTGALGRRHRRRRDNVSETKNGATSLLRELLAATCPELDWPTLCRPAPVRGLL